MSDDIDLSQPSGWARLERRGPSREQQAKIEAERRRVKLLFARVFGTPDGLEVLALLRSSTIEKMTDPNISERALSHLEGQRQLVHVIETWTAHGREQHPSELRRELPALRRAAE